MKKKERRGFAVESRDRDRDDDGKEYKSNFPVTLL